MTTKETPMVRMSGIIQDWAKKQGQRGEFIQIKLMVEGNRYPTTISDFNGLLAEARKGQHITLDVTEREGEYEGKPVTYRNVARVISDVEGEAPFPVPAATTQKPVSTPTGPATASTIHPSGDAADKDLSIRSQVALKEAWETVRDLIRIEKVGWDNPAVLHRLLADYTLMGMAVMREAMDAQKSK